MINVLLLTCGTNASFHFTKIIKKKFKDNFKIVGTDINNEYLVASSIYLDKFYKVPYSSSPEYYQLILNICKEEKIDYILPSFDLDQKLFYSGNPDLEKLGVKSFAINKNLLEIYEDKQKMNVFLEQNSFKLPQIYNIQELKDGEKYIIKPIKGVGSSGIEYLNKDEILQKNNIENFLIEEICTTPEITLECFNFQGRISSVARERIESKSGVCTKTRIYKDFELEKIAKRFASIIDLPMFFNIQFMKNCNNEYVITDVNLRLAGGMSLSYAAGWDEISAIANVMLKKSPEEIFSTLPNNIQEQYIVRTYTDIVTKKVRPTVAFDLDGTLLDSRERHQIVLDYVLSKNGIKLDTSNLIEFKKSGKNNIDFLISKGINQDIAKEIQKEWIENIEQYQFLKFDKLYPHTLTLLNEYNEKNDLILITARNNQSNCKKQLAELGLNQYFKEIYIVEPCRKTANLKADVLEKNNAILMIGDTEVDKTAAEIANIEFKLIKGGFRN